VQFDLSGCFKSDRTTVSKPVVPLWEAFRYYYWHGGEYREEIGQPTVSSLLDLQNGFSNKNTTKNTQSSSSGDFAGYYDNKRT
jgi:hypothetical protein